MSTKDNNSNAVDSVMSDRLTGTVKWFNNAKGFGFITPDSGGEEIFVHQSAINANGFRSLGEGEKVQYTVTTEGGGKAKAMDVSAPGGGFVTGDNGGRGGGKGSRGGPAAGWGQRRSRTFLLYTSPSPRD